MNYPFSDIYEFDILIFEIVHLLNGIYLQILLIFKNRKKLKNDYDIGFFT